MLRIVSLLLPLLLLACASDVDESQTQEQMFSSAMESLKSGSYETAIKEFNKLEARYPYSVYATQGILEIGYAHYKSGERTETLAQADHFIQLHPTHPNVDYAYFLKGLANEAQTNGVFATLLSQDITERDPDSDRAAFDCYRELLRRFPQSIYAADAIRRMQLLSSTLAANELHAARYYLERGAPLAAVNRAKTVLQDFPDSPMREEALGIMMHGYMDLGETTLSSDTRRILQENYPNSTYLAKQYIAPVEKPSWFAFWR